MFSSASRLRRLLLSAPVALLALAPRLHAQANAADSVAIVRVVQRYIDALAARDTAYIRAASIPGALTVGVPADGDPSAPTRVQTLDEVIATTAARTRRWTGRVWATQVQQDGGTAVFTAPYAVWLDGVSAACGVDRYIMARVAGEWRITQVLFTLRTRDCPVAPPEGAR